MVPAMIYMLGMPTAVVPGTSLLQIIFVAANVTVLQAYTNHTVDAVLALVLLVGGVVGARIGSRFGTRLRGEQLRFLLALMVLAVAAKLAFDMVAPPGRSLLDRFGEGMSAGPRRSAAKSDVRGLLLLAGAVAAARRAGPGRGPRRGSHQSPDRDHDRLYRRLGRAVRGDRRPGRRRRRRARSRPRDDGPAQGAASPASGSIPEQVTFANVPSFYAVAASRPIEEIMSPAAASLYRLGIANLKLEPATPAPSAVVDAFRDRARAQAAAGRAVRQPDRQGRLSRRAIVPHDDCVSCECADRNLSRRGVSGPRQGCRQRSDDPARGFEGWARRRGFRILRSAARVSTGRLRC